MFGVGDLVQTTTGTWITKPPTRCPNGHPFGAGQVLVGYAACAGHGGGHTTWTCRTCDETAATTPDGKWGHWEGRGAPSLNEAQDATLNANAGGEILLSRCATGAEGQGT